MRFSPEREGLTDREAPKAITKYRNRTNTSMSLGESRQLRPRNVIVASQRVPAVRHICLYNALTLLGRFKLGLMRRSQRLFNVSAESGSGMKMSQTQPSSVSGASVLS